MLSKAQELGLAAEIYSDQLEGNAREEAAKLSESGCGATHLGLQGPKVLLAGGETTVILKGKGRRRPEPGICPGLC